MIRLAVISLMLSVSVSAGAVSIGSKHALMVDENTGAVLLEKNANDIVPIASLTKLMTAMVVLDANLDMQQAITITEEDVDTLKHSSSRVPVGATFSRSTLLELALMSSDNRAAFALARTYPGGLDGFRLAVRNKGMEIGLRRTNIEEPTGLSPHNTSTATDLARLVMAAGHYPDIERLTTASADLIEVEGEATRYRNTNRLVGNSAWDIRLSKTGFTREAGRCLVMRVQAAGRSAVMILLNARESVVRTADAVNLHRMLRGEPIMEAAVRSKRKAVRSAKPARRGAKTLVAQS
jgi:D-alanyl-D-alanine carboxypeptidase/D-alanyl-D-alanine endopeptidase (penicillin-binding protein 7)